MRELMSPCDRIGGKRKQRSSSEGSARDVNGDVSPVIHYDGPALKYSLVEETDEYLTIIAEPINNNPNCTMARLKKCTDEDITLLLDSSESDKSDELFTLKTDEDDSSSDDSDKTIDSNKNVLLRNRELRREQASLRLRLRRSTEQSSYKIDTDSDQERPKRFTRRTRHNVKRLQDENKTPRKGTRIIRVPERYSSYDYSVDQPRKSILQRRETNHDENKLDEHATNDKKKIEKHVAKIKSSDSDCICISNPESTKLNTPRSSKRNRVPPVEDNNDSDIVPRIIRSSKRLLLNEESKRSNVPLNEKKINSKTDTAQYTSLNSTPKRGSKIVTKRINLITCTYSNECEPTIQEDKTDQMAIICKVTEDLSIKTKQRNKGTKSVTKESSPVAIQSGLSTPKSRKSLKHSALTPSVKMRTAALTKPTTPLQEARSRLHVSAVPKSLPCREEEFNNIYTFLEGKLKDKRGGCIYISGVPGTGKTATVNEVVKCLKRSAEKGKLDHFDFVEINGMKLSDPRQAYVQILKQLSGKVLTWEQAYNALEKRLGSKAKRLMTLLLVDELDLLCTKRQDVVYNLLDWPTKLSAQLVVITIANTMDLPERALMGRITSRLGLTRVIFQPYSHKQLQEIVLTRLKDTNIFKNEAIQLIARKVSAVSGDARRALDICRRVAEITETRDGDAVSLEDVTQALSEMIANPKIQAIKHCSKMEQVFLQAVCTEVMRTGVEEVCFKNVYKQYESLCLFDGLQVPNVSETFGICARLSNSRLLICEDSRNDIHQRILLNISKDDIHYALQKIDLD